MVQVTWALKATKLHHLINHQALINLDTSQHHTSQHRISQQLINQQLINQRHINLIKAQPQAPCLDLQHYTNQDINHPNLMKAEKNDHDRFIYLNILNSIFSLLFKK